MISKQISVIAGKMQQWGTSRSGACQFSVWLWRRSSRRWSVTCRGQHRAVSSLHTFRLYRMLLNSSPPPPSSVCKAAAHQCLRRSNSWRNMWSVITKPRRIWLYSHWLKDFHHRICLSKSAADALVSLLLMDVKLKWEKPEILRQIKWIPTALNMNH